MSILQNLKDYIATYSGLKDGLLTVDYIDHKPTAYGIFPIPGERIIETYISGTKVKAFPFALQSSEYTADELERLETNNFYESFADWLDSQTENGNLPTLDTGMTAETIEPLGWGYLFREGESDTGIYQIQVQLTYREQPQ